MKLPPAAVLRAKRLNIVPEACEGRGRVTEGQRAFSPLSRGTLVGGDRRDHPRERQHHMSYASLVKRGEVWWANVDEHRPVLVLSASADQVRAVIVVPPAPTIDGVTEDVILGAAEGLTAEGVVRVALHRPGFIPCNWLVTLAKDDMIERAGVLSPEKLSEVACLLRRAGLDSE
jgi:mRNA interferase MazF